MTTDAPPPSAESANSSDPHPRPPGTRWRTTRRRLLIGAGAVVGTLLVGVPTAIEFGRPRLAEMLLENGISEPELPDSPLVWFELTDSAITFHVPKVEMGQGIHTALAVVAAEELVVPAERLTVRQADTTRGFALATQFTFGSTSVSSLYLPVRNAAALVRAMLAEEAARQLDVDPETLTPADGTFVTADGRTVDYLAVVAGHRGPWSEPAAPPPLRPSSSFASIGRPATRVDMRAKLLGEATYGYDARLPNMLYGAVALPPRFGAQLVQAEPGDAAGLPGVRQVVIDQEAGFAGVVADTRTRAWAGVEALRLTWEGGTSVSAADLDAMIVPGDGSEIRRVGSVSRAFTDATIITAEYATPLAAHAHLEPLAALVRVEPGSGGPIEAWVPTQSPETVVGDLRTVFGEDREVVVHVTQLGGSFGRKAGQHLAVEAARLSAAVGVPVHVGWTREQDLGHGFYRPPTRTRLSGALDADGRLRGIQQLSAGGDIIWAVAGLPEAVREVLGFDPGGLLGQFAPYQLDAYRVMNRREQLPVPCGPWRGLGLLPNTFALESFMDELAETAGVDPLQFRLRQLPRTPEGDRFRRVLERAAELARWSTSASAGTGRGIACTAEAGTVVAVVAEVQIVPDPAVETSDRADESGVRVTNVAVAVDCGLVVDPAGARLQAQGSVVMGLSSALYEELGVQDGRVTTVNFDSYPIIAMPATPPITVEFVGDGEVPHGMGEPVIGPVPAAVANAVRAAGGPRLRRLPLRIRG